MTYKSPGIMGVLDCECPVPKTNVLTRALICPFLDLYPTYHPAGGVQVLKEAWNLLSDDVKAILQSATIKYMRCASGIGMGTAIKHLRRTTSGAEGSGLSTLIKYVMAWAPRSSTCDAQRAAPRAMA